MKRTVKSLTIQGPVGQLEALLGEPDTPTGAAVVCHPHPLYGGTMSNNVVYHVARALTETGHATLRFNFRSVGQSEGSHDHGNGEQDDLRAALRWLAEHTGGAQPIVAGFSFGARVCLEVGCHLTDPPPRALIALGVAPRIFDLSFLSACTTPKLIIQGDNDQFGPIPEVRRLENEAPPPCKLIVVEGTGHFFEGRLKAVRQAVTNYIGALPATA